MNRNAEVELDLFNYEFTSIKKPAPTGQFTENIFKKTGVIMSQAIKTRKKKRYFVQLHKARKAIIGYQISHAKSVDIGLARLSTSEFMSESFGLSQFFGGRYGY
jgi:hypothetical protein